MVVTHDFVYIAKLKNKIKKIKINNNNNVGMHALKRRKPL
jgi:hypothetical protein